MTTGVAYQMCAECGEVYRTAADLLNAHNQVLAADGLDPESDVEQVVTCPACVHDFAFLPAPCQCGTYYQVGLFGDDVPEPCPVHVGRRSA